MSVQLQGGHTNKFSKPPKNLSVRETKAILGFDIVLNYPSLVRLYVFRSWSAVLIMSADAKVCPRPMGLFGFDDVLCRTARQSRRCAPVTNDPVEMIRRAGKLLHTPIIWDE